MLVEKLKRAVVYFRRGWGYVALGVSFTNFVVITYMLLIRDLLPSVPTWLIVPYAITIAAVLFLVCVLVGRWDYRRGTWRHEAQVSMLNNPVWRDVLHVLYYLARNENDRAIQVLKKYVVDEQC